MIIGKSLIIVAFVLSIISGLAYLIFELGSRKNQVGSDFKLVLARYAYYLAALSVTLASAYLFYLFLTHQFQVKYVYGYSSRDLHLGYLISSFWAGQEGSFLFWLLTLIWMGVAYMRTGEHLEPTSMLFLNIINGAFLMILIIASPFDIYPRVPPDGAGLNVLLQNPWMVIHPPVLFVGYSAATIPFVIALAALIKREYGMWVTKAFPWAIFTVITLGAGIILGAFWAYEVLGWGGYWGWDPVENSSLIPWLVLVALVHGLVVQRRRGALQKTNFLLTIFSFTLVLYATFLTRSGILQDFSVHSFQDLGIGTLLTGFTGGTLLVGLVFFFWRIRDIPYNSIDMSTLNRENALLASIFVLLVSAILTFVGTSSPILTGLMGDPAQVGVSYYNKVNYPFGIIMALLLGVTPYLLWTEKDMTIIRRIIPSLILTIITTAVAIVLGVRSPYQLSFLIPAAFALWSNFLVLLKLLTGNLAYTGAQLSHVGLALMFVGIIISGTMDSSQILTLNKGETESAMGYEVTYDGIQLMPDGKDIMKLTVQHNGEAFEASPRLYFNERSNGMMREPHVRGGFVYDLYLSPFEYMPASKPQSANTVRLAKGQTQQVGDYSVTFNEFEMGAGHGEAGSFMIKAHLQVAANADTFALAPGMTMGQNGMQSAPEPFPAHSGATVQLVNLNADQKSVELEFAGLGNDGHASHGKPEQVVVQISKKPMMSILWIGSIVMVIGFVIALYRRIKDV